MTTSEDLQRSCGFLSAGEVGALKGLARALPPSPFVVNIGAGPGTSGLAFLESRPDLVLVTIDPLEVEGPAAPGVGLERERRAFEAGGFGNDRRWSQVLGDSQKVPWDRGLVDMVFVDGEHFHEAVMRDIDAWLPRIKPGGVICFHDYGGTVVSVSAAVDIRMAGYRQVLKVDTLVAFEVPDA